MTRAVLPLLLACLLLQSTARAQDDATFAEWDVDRARAFWLENAGGRLDCLQTLNGALRLLYKDPDMKLGSTVDLTMKALRRMGRADEPMVIGFFDPEGRETYGVTEPKTLRKSVWGTLVELAAEQPAGWHMFGFSPLDGYHSIVLSLDTRNPNATKVYWSDQWGSNGGFREYTSAEELDGRIEELTNQWWNRVLSSKGVKFKSDAKLYPMFPSELRVEDKLVQIHRLPAGMGVPIHTDQSLGYASALRDDNGDPVEVFAGQELELLGREGQWVRVRRDTGEEGWIHAYFVQLVDKHEDRVGATARLERELGRSPRGSPARERAVAGCARPRGVPSAHGVSLVLRRRESRRAG